MNVTDCSCTDIIENLKNNVFLEVVIGYAFAITDYHCYDFVL